MIEDTIKKSYGLFRKQYVNFIIGTIVAILMMIFIITIPPMIFGIYYMCVQLMKGKKVEISDVFKGFNYFFLSWGIILLTLLAVIVGLVFLIIPGLLLMILFQYVIAFALLENKGVMESMKRSYAVGKENFTFSIVFWILMAVINSLGGVTRIGILITIPFTSLCVCIAAEKLAGMTKTIAKATEKKTK